MIDTKVRIEEGMYGKDIWDKVAEEYQFKKLDKAAYIKEIQTCCEDHSMQFILQYQDPCGIECYMELSRKVYTDPTLLSEASEKGVDVSTKTRDDFIESLRIQEADKDYWDIVDSIVFRNVGWCQIPKYDSSKKSVSYHTLYRSSELIGDISGTYRGDLLLERHGTMDGWMKMVRDEVVGHTGLEVVVLAGLSAVVNGLVSEEASNLNPIFHIHGATSSGKSTSAMLAASCFSTPFRGMRYFYDGHGILSQRRGIHGSWGGSDAATLALCSGNMGSVVVLDELYKYTDKNLTSLLYTLSEGIQHIRKASLSEIFQLENFSTTFLSIGETSLLGKCRCKAGGLRMRVLEISDTLTESHEHAVRIQEACREDCGYAADALAEHIIYSGGKEYVLGIFKQYTNALMQVWPKSKLAKRFVTTFPALLLTTAELCKRAFALSFDYNAVVKFIMEHDHVTSYDFTPALECLDAVVEECAKNNSHFYGTGNNQVQSPVWGRINVKNTALSDGRVLLEEVCVYESVLKELIESKGYGNAKDYYESWENADLKVKGDSKHPTCKRKIGSTTYERVIVLKIYDNYSKASTTQEAKEIDFNSLFSNHPEISTIIEVDDLVVAEPEDHSTFEHVSIVNIPKKQKEQMDKERIA